LPEYAKKLGFGEGPGSVLAMLKTFPEHLAVQEEHHGRIQLKPIPTEQTKNMLAVIDESKKAKEERELANEERELANWHQCGEWGT
jgi:hypothetical protein